MTFSCWKIWLERWEIAKTLRRFQALIPRPFLRLWWGFLYLLVLMAFWRLGFLLYNYSALDASNFWLYLQAFYVGLRLDVVIAGVFTLPVFLSIWFVDTPSITPIYNRFLLSYYVFISFLISLLGLIDIFFFEEFNSHMNLLVLQANVMRHESLAYFWFEYPLIKLLLLLAVILWLCHSLFTRVESRLLSGPVKWTRLLLSALVSMVILVTALRGGWQERPIDWGYAMFSEDFMANQIALNGTFFLGRSVIELSSEKNLRKQLERFPAEVALADTKPLIISPGEVFVDPASLLRIRLGARSITPNIVLIILESHVGSLCGYINPDEQRVTPVLDSLAHSGLAFTRCFANGKRSAFGISSILMSWPVLPGLPLISQLEASRTAPSLASNLRKLGYRNIFLYGGDSQFDNMRGFALANGYDDVVDEGDLPSLPGTMWGIFDHYIFDEALKLLDATAAPLQLTMFTTSNHQPWMVPPDYADRIPVFPGEAFRGGSVHRTMAYVDRVLGEFMAAASSRPWFDNTLFIFVADHGLTQFKDHFENQRNGHIPLVFYGPQILSETRSIDRLVSQIDIMPTLFHIIGYPEPFIAMGRDALASQQSFAPRISNDYLVWIEGDYLYGELMGQRSDLFHVTDLKTLALERIPKTDSRFEQYRDRHRKYLQTSFTQFKAFGE